MRENLDDALKLMFGDEGGYANNPNDNGGPTKYGITHRTLAGWRGVPRVSAAQVRALTLDEAEQIYRVNYWAQCGGDVMPSGLDYAVFDFSVNSGVSRAVKVLQKVVGVKADGWIGAITMGAIRNYESLEKLIRDYCGARMKFLKSLKGKRGFATFGRGWTIRVTGRDPNGEWAPKLGVIGNALRMAAEGPTVIEVNPHGEAVEGGNVKAEPEDGNSWMKPEVILPGAGGLLGGAGTLFSGFGPVQWALAVVIVLSMIVGTVLIVRHLNANPA